MAVAPSKDIDITVDASRFRRQVEEYARFFEITRDEALQRRWKVVMQRVMGWTPPFNGRANNRRQARETGRAAVMRDIFRTVQVIKHELIRNESLRRLALQGDPATFQRVARDIRYIDPSRRVERFRPGLHEDQRKSRGRVPRTAEQFLILPTDSAAVGRHVGKKLNNVGDAKSGWIPGLEYGHGKAQEWINKHRGRAHGTFDKNILGDLEAGNFADGVAGLALRRIRSSIRADVNTMKREMARASKAAADKAGLQ